MKLNIIPFVFACIFFTGVAEAQTPTPPPTPGSSSQAIPLDPTGKRFMKPRERTKYGGPTPNMVKIEKGNVNINITFVEVQLDATEKNNFNVSVRGTKTPKLRGCDNCAVAGRIILDPKLMNTFEQISTDTTTQNKQKKNPAANRLVSFKTNDGKTYSVATTNEGGFMLTTLPNDTYSIWFAGKKVVSEFILTSVEPSPEDLKKEEQMRKDANTPPVPKTEETPHSDH
ncbi:MAG TPA: hypothetical protein PLP34_02055 [Chitinophagaceae bacterium]|nr:hypothetical protein [Chitinophagaceae bacterium]